MSDLLLIYACSKIVCLKNYRNIDLNKSCFCIIINYEHFKQNSFKENSSECTNASTVISFEPNDDKFGISTNKNNITIEN